MNATYTYDHFYKYGEITQILQGYAARYPEFCRLGSVGQTLQGREIWKLEVTDLSTGDFADKPGLCVTGNIHAGEVTGSMCAMYFLDYLFTNREQPEVADILKRFTVYCVPRISPDGSEHYLTTPDMVRSVPTMHPYDELQPGVQPMDLDGDGVIRQMRVKDPAGAWKISKLDPRVMTRRGPDDFEGDFYNVYFEGRVLDYDGVTIKPAPNKFGNDLNRNFPCNWLPETKQAGSGAYALSNKESELMAKYIYSQKNLCGILNFHTMGGMYLYPPGMKSSKECPREDMALYKALGKMATEETTYPAANIKDDYVGKAPMSVVGAFDDFNHFVMGLVNFTCECWDINPRAGHPHVFPRPAGTPDSKQEEIAAARLKWLDENNDGIGFKNWEKFDHPELGQVEIGGLDDKTVIQNPPLKFLPQEVEKHTRFLLRFIKTLPRLVIEKTSVTDLGGGNYRVEAVAANHGYMATYVTKEALAVNKAWPLTVKIEGAELVCGERSQKIGHLGGFAGTRVGYGHIGAQTMGGEPTAKKLTWVVSGKPGDTLTVTVSAPRAGKAAAVITL